MYISELEGVYVCMCVRMLALSCVCLCIYVIAHFCIYACLIEYVIVYVSMKVSAF